jgi:hypothetical protein
MPNPPTPPLRYSSSLEVRASDEGETERELVEQMLKISCITLKDEKEALRSVHAKSHGLLKGRLIVEDNLSAVLSQGLFSRPGIYPLAMRFSTTPGDLLPDSVSTPRALAIKIFDVPGDRLPGADGHTQDFVLATGKTFSAPDAKAFLKNVKLLASTTDKAEGLKVALSVALRSAESVLEVFHGESATLKSLGGYPETHILGESFFGQAPIRFGKYVAKIGVLPVSKELTDLTDTPLNMNDEFDALRQAVRGFFASSGGVWELRAQLCTNKEQMPIEDASVAWPEKDSPYVTVARIEVDPQESWSDKHQAEIDRSMSFSPWHCLAAHQPLGGIMRARKSVYEASARFRLSHNGCPLREAAGVS